MAAPDVDDYVQQRVGQENTDVNTVMDGLQMQKREYMTALVWIGRRE